MCDILLRLTHTKESWDRCDGAYSPTQDLLQSHLRHDVLLTDWKSIFLLPSRICTRWRVRHLPALPTTDYHVEHRSRTEGRLLTRNFLTTTTGPNISSCHIPSSVSTSVMTVGG